VNDEYRSVYKGHMEALEDYCPITVATQRSTIYLANFIAGSLTMDAAMPVLMPPTDCHSRIRLRCRFERI